jgi:hypothetical protein
LQQLKIADDRATEILAKMATDKDRVLDAIVDRRAKRSKFDTPEGRAFIKVETERLSLLEFF